MENNNQYPSLSSIIQNKKEYPTLSQINPNESTDMRYDAQGVNIRNQSIQKGPDNFNKSTNPMYDVKYDSESAKTNSQPMQYPQNQNMPNYPPNYTPNNMPNYSQNINNSYLDEKYDSEKAKGMNAQNPIYDNPGYNKELDTNYNSSSAAMGQYNVPPMRQPPYGFPHGPGMFPHFPHHPPFGHFPPPPLPPKYPYEGDYYPY